MKYSYYRAYCFYQKNGLAFKPHNYAAGIPTFICIFLINLIYYIGVANQIFPYMKLNIFIYGVMFFGVYYLNDKLFDGGFENYKKKWDREARPQRLVKGLLITALSLGSFCGIFVIANELRKLK